MVKQKPEEKARQHIDKQLEGAGWVIQDYPEFNLGTSLGVAVREFPLVSGFTDYLLFLERSAGGVLEAKPEGTTLSGVSEQTAKYLTGIPDGLPKVQEPPLFSYESTGTETYFRDIRDPDTRSRRILTFHKPETLKEWSSQPDTLRSRLKIMPSNHPLIKGGLRDCQFEAIQNLEQSFAEARPRALIQSATGSGKTYTAVSFIYRLIKFAGARRVLFLVDRSNLGRQSAQKLLTNIVSLIRFASGKSDVLEPFPETVNQRFERWREQQERKGVRFSQAQTEWLVMIKDHIATSLSIGNEDFELSPFYEKGGIVKAYQLFGNGLNNILEELNEVLAA